MNVFNKLVLALGCGFAALVLPAALPVSWNLETLQSKPQTWDSGYPVSNGVKSVFFEGVPYQDKPTRVFAYVGLPAGATAEKKVPGMVLVHGGSGSAFRRWVKFWNDRGYAAISMDCCGAVSGNESGTEYYDRHPRHEWAGPKGWGRFAQADEKVEDQWAYHAVAAVIRANSLLRSLPEVDADRIGLTGVSWGGFLTCVAAGVDHRFQFAAPVYGCGYLDLDSVWKGNHEGATEEQWQKWCGLFDPQHYLPEAKCRFLWIDGSNDFAFPLNALQKSVEALKVAYYRSTRVRMQHAHGAVSEDAPEIKAFADFILKKIDAYPFCRACAEENGTVTADFQMGGDVIKRVELCYTTDRNAWKEREWKTVAADYEEFLVSAQVKLPAEATAWFVNAYTKGGICVSSEMTVRTDEDIARAKAYVAKPEAAAVVLPDGLAADADFTVSGGKLKPELHGASWAVRSSPRGLIADDILLKPLKLTMFRTHDAPLVSTGQRVVDTHFVFPLMHLDAKDPKNYVFEPTDHYLKLNFDIGMKCLYRIGTSIEHTGTWGYNTLNPKDHRQYAEVAAGIVRHYVKGWANGYNWGEDRMKYWEIYNEPDVGPCWRGTREEFIDLFVTVLMRLKAEFPEQKFGGPAFGFVDIPFIRDLLKACKAAGVAPDFLSWHCYSNNPKKILRQPQTVRELCDELGFTECELMLNEWHYLPYNSWDGVHGSTSVEARRRANSGPHAISGIDSAVFTVQVETGFHDTPLAQSYFYGAGYNGSWGYVGSFGVPNKVYWGMKATGNLHADCAERAVCRAATWNVRAFGAWTKDRTGARLLVSDYFGKATEIAVGVKGLEKFAVKSVKLLDDKHNLEETTGYTFKDGRLTLKKTEPGSALFVVDFK